MTDLEQALANLSDDVVSVRIWSKYKPFLVTAYMRGGRLKQYSCRSLSKDYKVLAQWIGEIVEKNKRVQQANNLLERTQG